MTGATDNKGGSDMLTTPEVATMLGVSTRTVQRLIKAGELQAIRVGLRQVRIARQNVLDFMERRRTDK